MDDNFFGVGLASSFYDKRRHINTIYNIFMHYRMIAKGQNFINQLAPIVKCQDESVRFSKLTQEILTPLECSYLNYIKNRYSVPESDFITVLSGKTFYESIMKTPAGYYANDNWKLIIQMFYATLCVKPEYHKFDTQIQTGMILKIASGMRDITIDQNKYKTIVFGLNNCINKGMTNFNDLPKIENLIISKL